MHSKPRFACLGRPTLYAIIAAMLLPLLFSVTAPLASASPDKNWETPEDVESSSAFCENFENIADWTYSEQDTNSANYDGAQSTTWKTEGTYSYKLSKDSVVPASGDYAQIVRTDNFNFDNINKIFFDAKLTNFHTITNYDNAQIWIGATLIWEKLLLGAGTFLNQEYDTSGISGDQEVKIKLTTGVSLADTAPEFYVDDLRIFPPSDTKDDNIATQWRPIPENESGAWIRWDMGTVNGVRGARVYWGADENYRSTAYRIQTSTDNSSWTTVVTETSAAPASAWKEYSWSETLARHIRLVVDTHGSSGTEIFEMDAEVNFSPTIENITVDSSLIDRDLDYSGSGAELDTTITIRVKDNDGRDEILVVYISIRDNEDNLVVDNVQVTDNTVVDENTLDFTYTYPPADNLPDSALGSFDVLVVVEDNWGTSDNNDWGGDGASLFTVDDLSTTINFDPASPHVGWDLTVSGTHSRIIGSVSIDASWLIDNKHGQFSLGASNTYNQTYTISNADENENVGVTLRTLDSPLDGVTTSSYKVNENVKFQVWVRFEENYGVVGWVPDENRGIDLLFEWDGGTYPYTLTANPENITVPSAGTSINIVKLTDNGDDYWRYIIPPYSGGDLNFIIVDDISDVEQYRFFLQDYTAQYSPPTGQIIFRSWIGTDLAEINSDYWGADWRSTAWLVTGTQYQIWVRGSDAPLRLVGPIDAVAPADEKTIVVQVIIENVIPIFDDVYWNAWRIDNSTIRMEYQDNLDNTIEAHVAIFDENGVQQVEFQPNNEWFIVTWLAADGAESYEVVLTVQHGEHGDFVMTMPIGTLEGPPGVEGGVSEPWGLPAGMTIAGIGSVILVVIVGLSFDALRVQIGMLAMALTLIFTWQMGFLPLPGPYGGSFTATLILVMAVLFALTWRRSK